MKQIALKTLAVAAIAALPLAQAAAAPFEGGQSSNTYIEVGESVVNGGPHTAGLAGIGIYTLGKAMKVDFQGLSAYASQGGSNTIVYTLSDPIDTNPPAPDHTGMGVFSFAQVGTADVWYGEWSQSGGPNYSNRAVYYIGDKAGTTMPASGTPITYSVQGISKFNPSANNDLDGTFTVNSARTTVTGSIENGAGTLGISVNANISGSSFSGTAGAYNPTTSATLDSNGVSEGEFYGANAAALAGMATFSNNTQYNTAFGGTRN